MSWEANGISDARVGEALIKEVMQEELKEVPKEGVLPFTPFAKEVQTEQEQKLVTQLGNMIRIIGDRVKDDKEFQDAIDGIAKHPGSMHEKFMQLVDKVFEHGQISWDRIALLIYVAGRWAVKVVEDHLPQSVTEILKCILDFFREKLLGWILDNGGWINSFTELARVPIQSVSSMSSHTGLILIFITGFALGTFMTWRLTKRT